MPAAKAKGSAHTPLGPKNAIYSGQLCFCLQPRAAHALRSDQIFITYYIVMCTNLLCLYRPQSSAKCVQDLQPSCVPILQCSNYKCQVHWKCFYRYSNNLYSTIWYSCNGILLQQNDHQLLFKIFKWK